MSRLIVGCGYLGTRVAQLWRAQGDEVFATTRSAARADALAAMGFQPIVADVTRPETLVGLPPAATVLYGVGHDRRADGPSRWALYCDGLGAVLDRLGSATERVVYISSTGVYGDAGGTWVDEDSPCHPTREAGAAFWAGEQLLRIHPRGAQAVVLRLAGLYGPGRVPQRARIMEGQPLAVAQEGYLNLIHVEDAARVVVAAAARDVGGRTYLVADGHPLARTEYYRIIAELLGKPLPPLVSPPDDQLAVARAADNKRICNQRMLKELAVTLRYPNCREGLAAILREEQ